MKPACAKTEDPAPRDRAPAVLALVEDRLARRLTAEIERVEPAMPVVRVSSTPQLLRLSSAGPYSMIVLDYKILGGVALGLLMRELAAVAPVILIATPDRQPEAARLIAEGAIEFVARAGDFTPVVASLVERRLRSLQGASSPILPRWAGLSDDIGTIFRHEINNPLTGILGNAELVLAHGERLSAIDTQRLRTVVELAVRLRETVRRLSDAWEHQQDPPAPSKSDAQAHDDRRIGGPVCHRPGNPALKSA